MDKCSSDAEFDSYWDYEAKNKNRNRIRVGRQYQATVPPLLKPGERDGRRSEDLETLKWKPGQLSDQQVEEYLSMAKGIGLFAKAVDNSKTSEKCESSLQSAIKGLSEFVASHHPCHQDAGCQLPKPSSSSSEGPGGADWSPAEAQLFAQALEACGKNFCAIKKEYLPWKPVRSIIEYYYHGKGEKSSGENIKQDEPLLEVKKEEQDDEPAPSCSHEQKPCIEKIEEPSSSNTADTSSSEPKNSEGNFLDEGRVTEPERDAKETENISSTIGSLKFFLGGRLVLKLNARQDSGSGTTKCQWVQSNDLPKIKGATKRHKKTSQDPDPKKKCEEDISTDFTAKKPRTDEQGLLLCSSYWTPPVADSQDPVDMDDASSKTSEGYISPVLSNSRHSRVSEFTNNLNSDFVDSDSCIPSDALGDDLSSKVVPGKNSPSPFVEDGSLFKSEMLNHKSALSHHVKPCCPPRSSHSSSPLFKQWGKWSNVTYPMRTSPSSLSPVSLVDSKSFSKDDPLDLSSKLENEEQCESRPASSSPSSSIYAPSGGPLSAADCSNSYSPENRGQVPYAYCKLPYPCTLPKCTKEYPEEEVPLDLSFVGDSLKERSEPVPEENRVDDTSEVPKNNADFVEQGMLYHLLKSKASK